MQNASVSTTTGVTGQFDETAFFNGLTGAGLLQNAGNILTMSNGLATLASVVQRSSQAGNPVIVLTLKAKTGEGGHEEYIRTSTAQNLVDSLKKIRYFFMHSGNTEAIKAFNALPAPFIAVRENESNAVIEFEASSKEEHDEQFDQIAAIYGESCDWVWKNPRGGGPRVVVQMVNIDSYLTQLTAALDYLQGTNYMVTVKAPDDSDRFQRLQQISKALV